MCNYWKFVLKQLKIRFERMISFYISKLTDISKKTNVNKLVFYFYLRYKNLILSTNSKIIFNPWIQVHLKKHQHGKVEYFLSVISQSENDDF